MFLPPLCQSTEFHWFLYKCPTDLLKKDPHNPTRSSFVSFKIQLVIRQCRQTLKNEVYIDGSPNISVLFAGDQEVTINTEADLQVPVCNMSKISAAYNMKISLSKKKIDGFQT
jgi:hypothetical protein